MSKRVLLTGASGFVGHHCLEYFVKHTDWDIVCIVSYRHKGTTTRMIEALDSCDPDQVKERVKVYKHDLSVPIDHQLENLIMNRRFTNHGHEHMVSEDKIDVIINMASESAVERSTTDPVACLRNNYELAINVLEFARRVQPSLLIQISTDEVYGEAGPEGAHVEWDPILPSNPYCLLPGTKIITKFGWTEIQDFEPLKDDVLSRASSSNLAKSESTQKFTYDFDGKILRIHTRSDEIGCTPEHRFFRKETRFSAANGQLQNSQGEPITRRPYKKVVEVRAKELRKGDYLLTSRYIPYPTEAKKVNASLARFLGYFLGDGSYSSKSRYVRLADQKREYLEFYRTLLKAHLGTSPKSNTSNFGTLYDHSSKDCGYLQFSSERLRNIIDLSDKSNITNTMLCADKNAVLSFLAGFVDAEGYYQYEGSTLHSIQIFQAKLAILEVIQFLFRRNGIVSRIRKSQNGWKLTISDGTSLKIAINEIDSLKKQEGTTFRKTQHEKWNKYYYWSQITSIEEEDYKGKVYDLECPKYHNYVANYFIVHNSASKASQEAMSTAYWRTYGLPVVITNTMNIIGERQDPEKFLPKIIQKISLGEEMPIYGDSPSDIGSRIYLHAYCMADALVFLVNRGQPTLYTDLVEKGHTFDARPDRYNICGDRELNNLELAQMVAEILGRELKYRLIPSESARPGYDRRYALDGSKLAKLGWQHPMTLRESVERIVQWSLKNPHWVI